VQTYKLVRKRGALAAAAQIFGTLALAKPGGWEEGQKELAQAEAHQLFRETEYPRKGLRRRAKPFELF
jgi:hypothetical protein